MRFIITALFLISSNLLASHIYLTSKKSFKVEVQKYKNVRISKQACTSECIAKTSLSNLPTVIKTNMDGGINPTSPYCKQLGGSPRIYYKRTDAEVSVCVFKDHSFAFAWDLYRKSKNK